MTPTNNILNVPEARGRLRPQPWMLSADTVRLMTALTPAGAPELAPRFVGGCVRDALSNRLVVDIDIATPLKPEDVIGILAAAGIDTVPTGLKHGTVTAIVNGRPYEITTLRIDVMTFGRHAEVKFTDDWKTDAARRDFTINAMSCDMDGTVYDYFGGMEDLREGRIRFVGAADRRIHEDVLRILRYFRFLAHFGRGRPDAEAVHACQNAAKDLRKLSGERVRNEVMKLLEAQDCGAIWRLMLQGGVVTHVIPEATDWHCLDRLVALEERFEVRGFSLRRLAALLVVTPEGLKHTVQDLRLSSFQATQLFAMVNYSATLGPQTSVADMRRIVYHHGNDLALSLLLLAAARRADIPPHALYDTAVGFSPPAFPVTGQDAINMGVVPSAEIGVLLASVEGWWLSEDLRPNRDDCLDQLRTRVAILKDW